MWRDSTQRRFVKLPTGGRNLTLVAKAKPKHHAPRARHQSPPRSIACNYGMTAV